MTISAARPREKWPAARLSGRSAGGPHEASLRRSATAVSTCRARTTSASGAPAADARADIAAIRPGSVSTGIRVASIQAGIEVGVVDEQCPAGRDGGLRIQPLLTAAQRERDVRGWQADGGQYGRPGATVVFDFRLGRGRDGPKQFLGQFEGLLQTDGYAAYDQIGGPRMVHAACWSHAERYFSEAVQLNPQDPMATAIVARIDELFAIDGEARCQGLNVEARHALRQQQSRPLLGEIRKQIEAARSMALPGGALAKACNYTLTLWDKLTRFLEYPELELSNNLAENSMRPVALGRRNWIHIGSAQAGPKIAAILSVVESCRRLKFPVRDYLAAVLPGLADCPIQRLSQLTPTAWATQP